jgi:competence protein ComEA
MGYRRRELWLLLLLVAGFGVGLAVREFRSGFPDLSERLETFDTEAAPDRPTPTLPAAVPPRPPKLSVTHAQPEGRLDLNHATVAELQRLPGLGPGLAAQVIRARERRGRFTAVEDLLGVSGIGPKKLEGLRELVTVGE